MNWDQLEGQWKQLRGAIRQQFGKLTDDDLQVIAGHRDKFVGKLQERYGVAREEAQKQADEWIKALHQTQRPEETAYPSGSGKTSTGRP